MKLRRDLFEGADAVVLLENEPPHPIEHARPLPELFEQALALLAREPA